MNLSEFSAPLPKPWLNINAHSINADIAHIDSLVIDSLEAKSLTLDEQVSVPNPAIGKSTIFIDPSSFLKTTDGLGNTVSYLSNPATADEDMDSHNFTKVGTVATVGNVRMGAALNVVAGSTAVGSNITDTVGGNITFGSNTTQTSTNSCSFGDTVTLVNSALNFGNGNTQTVGNASTFGFNLTNNEAFSFLMGDNSTRNIRFDSGVCDLGTVGKPFKDLYLDGEIKGAGTLLIDAIQDQVYGVAPAGQRDKWQYTPSLGVLTLGNIRYWPSADLYHGFGDPGIAQYSTDGGVTWNPCVFDVVSLGSILIGYNGVIWAAVASGATNSYTSIDGINFTSGPPLPSANAESFDVDYFAAGGVFIVGVTDAGQRVMTSPDGLTWTLQTSNTQMLTVHSNAAVAIGVGATGGFIQWSADGITWQDASSGAEYCRSLAYSADKKEWMTTGYLTGTVHISVDNGVNWTAQGSAPLHVNDTLNWIHTNNYNRWYLSFVDSSGNYSLWSTTDSAFPFVGTHLDGAQRQPLSYAAGYDASRDRFWIGVNNSPYFAYATARPLAIKSLSDDIRVRGFPAAVGNYSMYTDTTCNNTVVETDISTNASSIGTLSLQASQPLGMVYELNVCMAASSAAGDNLAIRYYTNGGLLYTHNLVIPALSVNLPITINSVITIRNGAIHVCSTENVSGTVALIVSSAIVYDRTLLNTWSITAQWGAALSTLTVGMVHAQARFPNGA